MGELIFTLFYGGSIVILSFYVDQFVKRIVKRSEEIKKVEEVS